MDCQIVAPVCSLEEIDSVMQAGADEVYFGVMTEKWVEQYGNADFITRRQGENAHFTSFDDLSEIADRADRYRCRATLALNARYTERQLPYIHEILAQWEERGGRSVMVSDLELLLWLKDKNSKLKRHLSVMAGVFNSRSVDFFKSLDVASVVLPREMSVAEMEQLLKNANKEIEYEAIVMFQKCQFIDSFCGFFHAFNYRPHLVHGYTGTRSSLLVINNYTPCHDGHGCRLRYVFNGKMIRHAANNDYTTPYCAACMLSTLSKAGVHHFKIAGRGYPLELVVKSIRFIRQIIDMETPSTTQCSERYKSAFGSACSAKNCYYPW